MDRTEELEEIRRQLETLATARLGSVLRPNDEVRYRELCARELELLRWRRRAVPSGQLVAR